ncbi:MAG: sugar kinase [Firmicutes bacterium]|nr:sugar kinase [Bacillota bacterium]
MEKNKVVTFGEIMLRLSPPGSHRFLQATSFDAVYGGGEANVAVSLANFGLQSQFISKIPEHEIGQCAVNALRLHGVRTEGIKRGGQRLGIYFCESGASQRPSKVIYDRAGSSIAEVAPGEFDWHQIFQDAAWFHFTGITPALSDRAAAVTLEALQVAQEMKVKVSVDLNYRKKLWTPEKAQRIMGQLMEYVDVIISNEEDAEKVFGIQAGSSDIATGDLHEAGYREVARELVSRFGVEKVAITLRESLSASDNNWSGMLYDGSQVYDSRKYSIHLVDRVGGGDSFCGGLIYALLMGRDPQYAVEFAAAASCLKQTIHGDFNLVSVQEVEHLMAGDASGRIQR